MIARPETFDQQLDERVTVTVNAVYKNQEAQYSAATVTRLPI
jgi:hypothetical protein